MIWEVERLAELGDTWMSLVLTGHQETIGEIHAQTHTVRLCPGVVIVDRQVVVLKEP
jgi:hypothetical protein